jgi:hypothetical protein
MLCHALSARSHEFKRLRQSRSIILCSERSIFEQVPDIDTRSPQCVALKVGVLAVRLG